MTRWLLFKSGWLRYWRTFSYPWSVVLGFAAAAIVSDAVYELLKTILFAVVDASR